MIYQLVRNFEKLDRDIDALSNFLVVFIVALVARAMLLAYQGQYDGLWSLLGSIAPIVAALLVSKTASRLITNGNIVREDEKRREIVRVTHHLLAITQDLRARVGYVKNMLTDQTHPAFALGQVAVTIERRYETLLEKDAYQFLPGKCVDIIINISGSIFGIGALAEGVKQAAVKSPLGALGSVLPKDNAPLIAQLNELMDELQTLINGIYEVRSTLDTKKVGA